MYKINWHNVLTQPSWSYKCGYCGTDMASEKAFLGDFGNPNNKQYVRIYICHKCSKPTFFDFDNHQNPGPLIGNDVKHIPDPLIEQLFNEAKSCFSISAFTSSVMCCRKLLMNIAVKEGADEGKSFVDYVNYLDANNYIPPNGKKWVDSIRKLGNEANHKIEFRTLLEATRILNFGEMLLRFIYELPGIMNDTDENQ
jgi:DNA-directed RNA polymerase subunit RPC12/RpoP